MQDPDSGEQMVDRVYESEELYQGPHAGVAPDLVLSMREGYDPKGRFGSERLTYKDHALVGMHTTPDALLYIGGLDQVSRRPHITDVAPTILELLDVPAPADLDGRSLLV
jgi:predicted AlkP superfamily phosphohydrolase/phosphomutase